MSPRPCLSSQFLNIWLVIKLSIYVCMPVLISFLADKDGRISLSKCIRKKLSEFIYTYKQKAHGLHRSPLNIS